MAGITLHPPMTDPTTPIPTCFGVYTTVIVFTMVHNPSQIATAHSTVVFSRRHGATRAEVQTWHSQAGRRCFCIWQSNTMTTMSTPPTWTRSPLNSSFFLLSAHPHRRHDALKLLFKGERVQVGGVDIVVIVLDCQMQKHLLPACERHVFLRIPPCCEQWQSVRGCEPW